MRKFISIIILSLISIPIFASDWMEVQCVEIPQGTPVYYYNDSKTGKTKYTIYINGFGVSVSETNAKEFISGRRRLELVKWYNGKKDAYKYTIRQLKPKDINLYSIFEDDKIDDN